MEITTSFDDLVTSNNTVAPFSASPRENAAPMSFFPPGYFVIPAADMGKYRLAMYTTIIPLTTVIGLVGNAVSFVVLLRHKMPKTTKMVLLAITIYDFLNLLTAILFSLLGIANALSYQEGLNLGRKGYQIFGSYLMLVFGRISSLLIVVMSVERFCAVFFPLKIKTIWTRKVMSGCIIFCTIFTLLFFIPNALEYRPLDFPIPNSTETKTILILTDIGRQRQMYATFYSSNMIITRIIPVFIVMACNVSISVSLYRSKNTRSQMTSRKTDETSAEQRITRTLLSISVLYLICMLPNALLIIITLFDTERPFPYNRNNVYNLAGVLFYWFEVINSAANFIIYIFSNAQMRAEFKKVVGCGDNNELYETGSSLATSMVTVSGTVE